MIVQRTYTRVEPVSTGMSDPYGIYFVGMPGVPDWPSWFPRTPIKIVRARVGHQNPSSAGDGQYVIGIDPGRIGYRTAKIPPGYEDGDETRWNPLANIWFSDPRRENTVYFNPPVLFDPVKDGFYIDRRSGSASSDIMWWDIAYEYDTDLDPDSGFTSDLLVSYTEPMLGSSAGWTGYVVAIVIPQSALAEPFQNITLGLQAPDGVPLSIGGVMIAPRGAGDVDFASAPSQITYGGSGSFTISAGLRVALDECALSYSGTGDIVVRMLVQSDTLRHGCQGGSNLTRYYLASGAASLSTLTPAGFSTGVSTNLGIAWIATR